MIYPHEIVPLNQIDQNLHIKLELDDILKQNGINALKAKKITINRPQKKKNVSVPIKAPDSYSGYSQVHEMKIKRPENFKIPRVKSFLEKGFVNDAMPAKENAAASNLDEGSDGISSEISSSPSSIFREHNYSSFQVAGPLASDNVSKFFYARTASVIDKFCWKPAFWSFGSLFSIKSTNSLIIL